MGALARALDWSQTRVGPVDAWPQSLHTAVSILLESKFPMLLCWGPEFVQFYNDPFRPILGLSKHPALGRSSKETFAEAWHIIGPLFDQVMQGNAVGFDDMLVPLDRNGFLEECYFLYSYSPIRDESGGVGGVLVTCTETTARVLAERRLVTLRDLASQAPHARDEETAWRHASQVLAANAADLPFSAIYALDDGGRDATVVWASSGAMAPHRIRADDVGAAWPLFQAAASASPVIVDDVRRRFGENSGLTCPETIQTATVLPITRPGLPQPYGFLVAGVSPRLALDDKYRDFLTLVGEQMASSIANARGYEEERHRTQALMELDRQKTAFFSNVSHEFRTPLTLLLAPLEQAMSHSSKTLGQGDVELVHRNAARLLRLVNTLLDFSRIEAGRARLTLEATDLSVLTRELASTFKSLMEQAGLEFDIDCPPVTPPVLVDRGMWEQIVLNLLSNAFKFTLHGMVGIRLCELADRIELSVCDTGAGIPAADVPRVFDRFHRVPGTRARTFEGSGIGLALVRELVHMHDGEIAVTSVEGRGSTFTVTMPRRAVAPSASAGPVATAVSATAALPYIEEARRWDGHTESPAPAANNESPAGTAAHPPARILVVDDNLDMREYLIRLLADEWTVDVAGNGREALQQMAVTRPDLIVTDVMMPDLDGTQLLREIRRSPSTRLIPVLMLSARSGEESRIEGLAEGADDYIVKPFSARELVARVRTQLEMSRLRRETAARNDRLLTLINTAPAAIAVVRGPNHVYELANDRYLRLVGRGDIVGTPGREALPELVAQGIWDLFDRIYASGEPYVAHEFRVELDRLGSGTLDEGFFDFALQPLKDIRGATEGILIHAVELTEQVTARRDVDDARRAAEAANRAKDEFLAMLGHELRNPLAPILTALQLMTLRGDSGALEERAVIERQVRHVVRLVDDLLDVSRIARGKIDLKSECVEFAAIVAKALEMTAPVLEQKHQRLEIDVAPAGLAVEGDPTRLQQVVFNLLNNAAKYTEAHGCISVTATHCGETIELRVRDSGIGIDSVMLPHIFDLFVQDHQAIDRAQGGLGLGLAIVRNLVELHGGRVSATSAGRGHGSEFVVSLPASSKPLAHRPMRLDAVTPPTDPGNGVRVLIVDDNEDAARTLAAALALVGFDTRTAADGAAALRAAEGFAPHVGLLDLGLPVMDGYELAERLRQTVNPQTLIAVSGYGAQADQQRSRESGFDLHLVKPVDVNELTGLLRRLPAARDGD